MAPVKIPNRLLVLLLCLLVMMRMNYLLVWSSFKRPRQEHSMTSKFQGDSEQSTQEQAREIVDRWNERSKEIARTISNKMTKKLQQLPSPDEPFVFFHMRKGGGSSVKTLIFRSVEKYKLDHWITCKGKNPCIPFSMPWYDQRNPRKAVYVGHLNWSHMAQLMRETIKRQPTIITNRTFVIDDQRERTDFYNSIEVDNDRLRTFGTCLTNLRPTVSRVVSCWNYRFVTLKLSRMMEIPGASNATIEEWKILLQEAVDFYGNGCNNEMYRIFGSTQHEKYVNQLSIETYGPTHYLDELETVLGRMANCVMIRIDRCKDSITILQHYLPWIDVGNLCGTHNNEGSLSKVITDEARNVILAQNSFDELVFNFGEELFEAQLKVAKNETEGQGKL